MVMCSKVHLLKPVVCFSAAAMILIGRAMLAATPVDQSALNYWQAPKKSFQKVGGLIGQGDFKRASAELNDDATKFPAPYGVMAADYAGKLDSALAISDPSDPKRLNELAELCTALRACDAALRLQSKANKKDKPYNNDH